MKPGNGIPFVDLVTPHLELESELIEAIRGVIRTGGFIGGPVLEKFEKDFAQFCDATYCIGVSSGTDALRFALMAADIGKGDIVITVANTFVATVEAILQAGATPHFVDVDPRSFNMSVESLRDFLKTQCVRSADGKLVHKSGLTVKALLPIHLYGQMADMDALGEVAEEYGVMLFEDACQAHGSEYFSKKQNRWMKAGSVGKAAGFSFYPGKNLGACGEAGAVTTNDPEIASRIRMIRDHGQNKKYYHLVEGYNGRLDAMQAAILQVKLPHLKGWNENRRVAADIYSDMLSGVENVLTPLVPEWSKPVHHLYVICVENRDEVQKYLGERNIATGLHYPVPVHLQKGYAHLGYREGDLPVTEKLAYEILSLPIYPQIRAEQQERVVDALLQFCNAPEPVGEKLAR